MLKNQAVQWQRHWHWCCASWQCVVYLLHVASIFAGVLVEELWFCTATLISSRRSWMLPPLPGRLEDCWCCSQIDKRCCIGSSQLCTVLPHFIMCSHQCCKSMEVLWYCIVTSSPMMCMVVWSVLCNVTPPVATAMSTCIGWLFIFFNSLYGVICYRAQRLKTTIVAILTWAMHSKKNPNNN